MQDRIISGHAAKSFLQKLHEGEEGMETVQIIMIMAIAAMILTGVNSVVGVGSSGTTTGGGLFEVVTKGLGGLFGGNAFGIGDVIGNLF